MNRLTNGNHKFLGMFKADNDFAKFYTLNQNFICNIDEQFFKKIFYRQFSKIADIEQKNIKCTYYNDYGFVYVFYNNGSQSFATKYSNFNIENSYFDSDGSLYDDIYYPMSTEYPKDESNKKTEILTSYTEDQYRNDVLEHLKNNKKYHNQYLTYLNSLLAGYEKEIPFFKEAKPFVILFESDEYQKQIISNYFDDLIFQKQQLLDKVKNLTNKYNSSNSERNFN